jgi:hypothetical protein
MTLPHASGSILDAGDCTVQCAVTSLNHAASGCGPDSLTTLGATCRIPPVGAVRLQWVGKGSTRVTGYPLYYSSEGNYPSASGALLEGFRICISVFNCLYCGRLSCKTPHLQFPEDYCTQSAAHFLASDGPDDDHGGRRVHEVIRTTETCRNHSSPCMALQAQG